MVARKKKVVAKKSAAGLFPTELSEAQQGSNIGNENVGNDVARPTIKLLQALSPEIDESRSQFVKGAKSGQLINSVTGELYDELYVSNVAYDKYFAIFRKRSAGGGFEGQYPTQADAATAMNTNGWTEATHEIVETASHICALINTETQEVEPVQFLMSSTKLSVSKNWNSQILGKGGDRFSSVWKISSVNQKNAKGSFFNMKIEHAGFCPDELHEELTTIYNGVQATLPAPAA